MAEFSESPAVPSPYLGLRPFRAEDQPHFFGRDQQIEELLDRLYEHRFVAVVGLSGAGKSSLVRAGVVPRLRQESAEGSAWRVATLQPGTDPMGQLAAALDKELGEFKQLGKSPDRREVLESSSFGLIKASRDGRKANEPLLVVVDQFEEVFRDVPGNWDFVRVLLTAVEEYQVEYPISIVLTMRTDYLGDCAAFRGLPEALNSSQYLVPRMTQEQIRDAIEQPAKLAGGRVDFQLLQQLLIDCADNADQLPILQHLLMRMWAHRKASSDGWLIDLDSYREAGGWKDALNKHGRDVLGKFSPVELAIAKRILQRVTEAGQGRQDRRRLTPLSELVRVCKTLPSVTLDAEQGQEAEAPAAPPDLDSAVRRVLGRLSEPGVDILTIPEWHPAESGEETAASDDPGVNLTHESLIRQWDLLRDWAAEEADWADWCKRVADTRSRKGRLVEPDVSNALARWKSGNFNAAWAERYSTSDFAKLTDFLNDCHREERWKRNRLVIATVAFAAIALVAVFQWWQARETNLQLSSAKGELENTANHLADKRAEAEQFAARERVAAIESKRLQELADTRKQAADASAMEARRLQELADTRKQAADASAIEARRLQQVAETQKQAADASAIEAQRQRDEAASLRATALARQLASEYSLLPAAARTSGLALLLAVESVRRKPTIEGLAALREVAPQIATIARLPDLGPLFWHVWHAWSPDGRWAAMSDQNGELIVLQAATGETVYQTTLGRMVPVGIEEERFRPASVFAAGFSQDGKLLAFQCDGDETVVIEAATGRTISHLNLPPARSLALAPDGKWLAASYRDGTVRVLATSTGREAARLMHESAVGAIAFSADGKRVTTGSVDGAARVLEVETKRELSRLNHRGAVIAVSFSPDGNLVATGSEDQTVRVMESATGRELVRYFNPRPVTAVAFADATAIRVAAYQMRDRTIETSKIIIDPKAAIDDACARVSRNLTREEWARYLPDDPYRATCPNLPPAPPLAQPGKR